MLPEYNYGLKFTSLSGSIFNLALAFADQDLSNVQDEFAGHRNVDAQNSMAIARDNLREQFEIPDFLRPDEGGDVFVQAVEFQQFVLWRVSNCQSAAFHGIAGSRAQGWDFHFVDLLF